MLMKDYKKAHITHIICSDLNASKDNGISRRPKKILGQNFLVDENIQRKIVQSCALKPTDNVLEIGAGRGELTKLIVKKAAWVYALEIDSYLCSSLKDKLKEFPNLSIINKDILDFNIRRNFRKTKAKLKVVGNIPYYITTAIIQHLLRFRDKIETILITVQREFANRITASCGTKDYGSFSCFIQYYTESKVLFLIKKTCFRPMPKVDSIFLRMDVRKKPKVMTKDERLFFRIIRAAFGKRRKTLRNSLKGIISKRKLEEFFYMYSIDPNIRPQDLDIQSLANLTNL